MPMMVSRVKLQSSFWSWIQSVQVQPVQPQVTEQHEILLNTLKVVAVQQVPPHQVLEEPPHRDLEEAPHLEVTESHHFAT